MIFYEFCVDFWPSIQVTNFDTPFWKLYDRYVANHRGLKCFSPLCANRYQENILDIFPDIQLGRLLTFIIILLGMPVHSIKRMSAFIDDKKVFSL